MLARVDLEVLHVCHMHLYRWNKSAPDVLPDQLGFNHLDTGSAAWKDISQSFVAAQGAMRRAAGLSFPSFRHTLSWARRTATGNDGHGSPFRGPDSLTNQLSRSSPGKIRLCAADTGDCMCDCMAQALVFVWLHKLCREVCSI